MKIDPGTALLHYRLVEKIGEGGMGVVWKAVDTKLDREVAIKVLPHGVAGGEEQRIRFEREAKLLAAVNHPNIAAVRAFHESDGEHFIEMELVEGEDLAKRLARGPIPVDETLAIAAQVAAAVEAAHEQGVIHRDLKPGNIKVMPDGTVKVLDFGLAKALSDEPSPADRAVSPTVTSGGTLEGVIVGTAAYMSPEQARGEPLDKRTDIWSFGCVLYECLTGTRAFPGRTTGDAISSVLTRDPDLDAIPAGTPPGVVKVLRRCLTKKSRDRLRDIGDARIELADLDAESPAGEAGAPHRTLRFQRSVLLALVILLLAWLVTSLVLKPGRSDRPARDELTAHWPIILPKGSILDWHRTSRNFSKLGGGSPLLALSPDGQTVVYSVARGNGSQLYRQRLDELEGTPIADTQDARGPFFSPDGKWVGFLADNALQVVSLERGGARRVCDVSSQNFAGGWTPDGERIVYSTNTGIWRVPVQGGAPELLVAPKRTQGEREFSLSSLLPDGSGLLFTTGSPQQPVVMMLDLENRNFSTITTGAAHARYVASGHLIYAHDRVLWSVPFDPSARGVTEAPAPLLDGVHTTMGAGGSLVAHYAVADNGVLAYVPAPDTPPTSSLVWVDRQGNEETIVRGPGKWEHPRVSLDGQRVAFDTLDDLGKDVYIAEIGRGQLARLTTNGATTAALWAKDGSRVLGADLASNGIASIAADFSGRVEHYPNPGPTVPGGWGPEGRILLFTERDSTATDTWAIGTVRVDQPDSEPRTLLGSAAIERWPSMSPDGRWMAYVADESGTQQIFVQPFPELDRKIKVSTGGGGEPLWSKDGTELFFRADGYVFVVGVDRRDGLRAGVPQRLFDASRYDAEPGGHQHYDVSNDGKRFAMIKHVEEVPTELRVIVGALP